MYIRDPVDSQTMYSNDAKYPEMPGFELFQRIRTKHLPHLYSSSGKNIINNLRHFPNVLWKHGLLNIHYMIICRCSWQGGGMVWSKISGAAGLDATKECSLLHQWSGRSYGWSYQQDRTGECTWFYVTLIRKYVANDQKTLSNISIGWGLPIVFP